MDWDRLLSTRRLGKKANAAEQSRSAFEQDYDRIIFSHPFRRLQDKTQVHPLPEFDFVHTRLTHSLEVSSVARSLGRKAGEVIIQRHKNLQNLSMFDFGAVTAAAALAHDIGNPPFGHAGEAALADYFSGSEAGLKFKEQVTEAEWNDLTRFEGNAQGFRLLNANDGLRLTGAALGAFTKYPCSSSNQPERGRKSQKKFGFFQSEKESFEQIAEDLGLIRASNGSWRRHPLAFLVEAADDICYSIIDLEDGCRLGLVDFKETVDLLAPILGVDFNRNKLEALPSRNEQISILRAMAINKLVDQCTDIFLSHEQEILNGQFDKALTDKCISEKMLEEISRTSVEKIYRSRQVIEIEAAGHEVLPGLLHEFIIAASYLSQSEKKSSIPRKYSNIALLFPSEIRNGLLATPDTYSTLRIVLDFVSGLTDKHAIGLYRKLKGISV